MNGTIERLIEGNREYVRNGKLSGDVSAERRAENAAGQRPYAAIVACSDSRVIPEAIFSAGLGELFVVRTAGNVIGDSELASLEYAVRHLKTDTVVVMGHTSCGAVHAALCGEFEGAVGAVTKRIKTAIRDETDPDRACVLNVTEGVACLKRTLGGDGLTVVGAVYDVLTGRVELL